ncbi:MAG TPA: DUF47 family protein [Solirubrobacteraceae bacterium]|nr:DUF47 family protein [Solirubrobacteraceae bacterium]
MRRETDLGVLDLFEAAGRNAQASAVLLRELMLEFPDGVERAAQLKDLEHEGDRLTHDIIHRLRARGGTPEIDVQDGHALASALDDVVDLAEQTADWLVLYAVEAPMEQGVGLVDTLVEATEAVVAGLCALRTDEPLAPHLAEINRIEDEGDRLYRDAVASLFANGIDPMVVIRWKDIFAGLEGAVDACEKVAHVLDGISLKRSS